MVKKVWNQISLLGTAKVTDPLELQSLMLTNRISMIAVVLMPVIGVLLGLNQWNEEAFSVLALSVVFGSVPWLMKQQLTHTARIVLCFSVPILVVGMSVLSKTIPGELVTESEYFDYRYVLLATGLIPVMVFTVARWKLLATTLAFYLLAFVAFDPIHDYFQVGYHQIDHSSPSYYLSGWLATLLFGVIVTAVLILRSTSNEIQLRNSHLIRQLNAANVALDYQRDELEQAQQLVRQRNQELNEINEKLTEKIAQATLELKHANAELVKHNSELQQFSFTISHNLRGPVASMLGLLNLIRQTEPAMAVHPIVEHLMRSAKSLDATIRDLGLIIDIRNDIYRIRQKINVANLLNETLAPFQRDIEDRNVHITYDLQAHYFYSIRPTLSSIVYNLLSNALKYLSPERPGSIHVATRETPEAFQITVQDNGLGIDLVRQGDNLFKLYKRFHSHTEGKGIGLYLVKMQTEILGGTIEVASEPDQFTRFSVVLPKTTDIKHQPLLREPYAEVYFDATRNLMGIDWHSDVDSDVYRKVLGRALDFMRECHALHWLLDVSKRGPVNPEEQLWLLEYILPSVFKLGLKRLAVVYTNQISPLAMEFYQKNVEVFRKHDIEVFFTRTVGEAEVWLANRLVTIDDGTTAHVGQGTAAVAQ